MPGIGDEDVWAVLTVELADAFKEALDVVGGADVDFVGRDDGVGTGWVAVVAQLPELVLEGEDLVLAAGVGQGEVDVLEPEGSRAGGSDADEIKCCSFQGEYNSV